MNLKKALVPILSLMFLISGISFITNSATYISDSQKEIIRDSKRLNDLTIFRKAIEDYKTKNGYYPKLETGTNIKGYVNSAWTTQWTSFCNLIGLNSCPVDPINTIIGCDCSAFSLDGKCENDNINSNIDNISCYNSKTQTFVCTDSSNIYQYQSLNNGRNYSLSMEFEYSDNVNWEVASSSSDNVISIKGSCISGNYPYKIFSNKTQKCGDGILNYGEVCEVGSKKTEFCKTSDNKTGIRYINCSSSCLWDLNSVGECLNIGFCGDSIIQEDKGEECDGGYQKMCYNYQDYLYKNPSDLAASNSHHNWYNEQLRYCGLNCKWNSNYIDSTAYCGGYCGDNIVQGDKGEECDDSNNKHCDVSTCKYKNSKPVIDFDFYNDRLSEKSYIKSDVWSGDKLQYQNNYYDPNTVNLIPADKQDKTYVAIWNSDFIEIKINVTDKENDGLFYKYNFPISYNYNFIVKYAKSSDASKTFYNYNLGEYIKDADIIRMYPTTIKNGKNTYKYWVEDEKNLLFGSNYEGFYGLEVTVQEDYKEGQNSSINPHNSVILKTIDFKIGPGCGDKILQKELGETCEWKPGVVIDSIMVDWGIYIDPNAGRRFRQPDGNGDCAAQIFTDKVGNLTFNYPGKVDDVSCTNKYYGICEKRIHLGCETGWIKGDYDNCYKLTSKTETWKEAQDECASYNASLISYTDIKESDFIKKQPIFNAQTVWIGVHKVGNYWEEDETKIKMAVVKPRIGAGIFSTSIYDAGVGSSVSNANYCGLPLEFEACQDNRGYCGDGLKNPQFKSCDPKSDEYSYFNADVAVFSYTAADTNYFTQYFCATVEGKYGKTKPCTSFNGYCGDGLIQYNLNNTAEVQGGNNEKNTIVVDKTHPGQCDPEGHSVNASTSSKNNTYTCGSADSDLACLDLDYSKKNLDDIYGGYCGDGFVQYNLTDIGIKNDVANISTFKTTVGGTPEQCDPLNHSVTPNISSVNYQYACGAAGAANACTDIDGYCGDKVLQSNYGEKCEVKANGKYDLYDGSKTFTDRDNLTCNSNCGYASDGWTCATGYYWNKVEYSPNTNNIQLNACVLIPANSTIRGTLHGGDDYACNERYEKDGLGGCVACEPGYYSTAGGVCTPCTAISNSNWVTNGSNPNNCEFNCKASFKYDVNNRKCNSCEVGKWTSEANRSTFCSDCTLIPNMTSWLTNGVSATTCDFNCNERYSYNKSNTTCNVCATGTWTSAGNQVTSCPGCTNKPSNSHYTSNGSISTNCNWECDTDYNKVGSSCILRTCDYPNDYEKTSSDCISNSYTDTYYQKKASSNCTVPNGGDGVTIYSPVNGSSNDTVWCYGDRTGTYDCARVGDIPNNACWYCNFSGTGTVSDSSACSNRGTRSYTYTCDQTIHTVNWWSGWSGCSCNTEYYGSACESTCSYGGWYETSRDCQSNSQWYVWYSRSVTGSNCGGASSTSGWAGTYCSYCTSSSGCAYTTSSSCVYYNSNGYYMSGYPTCRSGYYVSSYNPSISCGTYATWTSANCVGTNVCNTNNHTYNGCP